MSPASSVSAAAATGLLPARELRAQRRDGRIVALHANGFAHGGAQLVDIFAARDLAQFGAQRRVVLQRRQMAGKGGVAFS